MPPLTPILIANHFPLELTLGAVYFGATIAAVYAFVPLRFSFQYSSRVLVSMASRFCRQSSTISSILMIPGSFDMLYVKKRHSHVLVVSYLSHVTRSQYYGAFARSLGQCIEPYPNAHYNSQDPRYAECRIQHPRLVLLYGRIIWKLFCPSQHHLVRPPRVCQCFWFG